VVLLGNVLILSGPTAVGKTKLSIELAKSLNGEIISADSMQVYKYMNIGTAKPDEKEMAGIKHYLIDEVYPDEEFSVAEYQKRALKYIDEVLEKGKLPIVTGGTGLYINSLLYNINYSDTISDWKLREELRKLAEEKGNEYLHSMLREIDPKAAERIHMNDVKRVIRAIEVFKYSQKPISYHQEISRNTPPKHDFMVFGLNMDRERLYERINNRVDEMFERGLVEEVRNLVKMGYHRNTVAMQGLGYKEILYYFRGLLSFPETIELLKRNTRRYAKRQLTWFRRIENMDWINVDEEDAASVILKKVKSRLASSGIIL